MQQSHLRDARAVAWDKEPNQWDDSNAPAEVTGVSPRHSWLTRQCIAFVWIVIAWIVGTLVFEIGAIG